METALSDLSGTKSLNQSTNEKGAAAMCAYVYTVQRVCLQAEISDRILEKTKKGNY